MSSTCFLLCCCLIDGTVCRKLKSMIFAHHRKLIFSCLVPNSMEQKRKNCSKTSTYSALKSNLRSPCARAAAPHHPRRCSTVKYRNKESTVTLVAGIHMTGEGKATTTKKSVYTVSIPRERHPRLPWQWRMRSSSPRPDQRT